MDRSGTDGLVAVVETTPTVFVFAEDADALCFLGKFLLLI